MVYYSKTSMNEGKLKPNYEGLLKLTIDRQKYDIVAEYIEYINKKIISVLQEILEYFYINILINGFFTIIWVLKLYVALYWQICSLQVKVTVLVHVMVKR
jgi:hypothetical protein